jgi:membrane fusion protein, copper/silver efflux system
LLTDTDRAGSIADIEEARALFEIWAKAAIEATQTFGHANPKGYYIASCPMAFDWRGAEWLQSSPEINNPYFGASMLRCGLVRGEF